MALLALWKLKGIPFIFRDVHNTDNPLALNQYLLDDDCTYVLKRCYQENTKDEITEDEEIMKDFFGSSTVGKAALNKITQEVWDNMD